MSKNNLKSEIKITLYENTYTIKLPKVGQLIDIENAKAGVSGIGFDVRQESGAYTNSLANAIAYFSVLIPELKEDLTVKSIYDITLPQSKQLVRAYVKEFKPWWDQWIEEINRDEDEDSKKEKSDSEKN